MSRLLPSLAFIHASIREKKTIWDTLALLTALSIKENQISDVNPEIFCSSFFKSYGFKVPIHPMNTIINNLVKKKIIYEDHGHLFVLAKNIEDLALDNRHQYEVEKLVVDIKEYVKEGYAIEWDNNEIERILFTFLNQYDADIFSSIDNGFDFPIFRSDCKEQFIIGSYIKNVYEINSQFQKILEDVIFANIHLNSIFFVEDKQELRMKKSYIYLDTRIVLRLLGIEGIFRKEEYENLISLLRDAGCKLRIFKVHFEEINFILNECVRALNTKDSPRIYKSHTLEYFIQNKYTIPQILAFTARLKATLSSFHISVDENEYDTEKDAKYHFHADDLRKKILESYYGNVENGTDKRIENDIEAISNVFFRRKESRSDSLEDIKCILLTTNTSLAKAVKAYNHLYSSSSKFNEVVSDTFFGTIIWMNTSYVETPLFRKKIIADAISITDLSPSIKQKYLEEVERLKSENELTKEEYFVLKMFPDSYEYLREITCNDDNYEFEDKTIFEILSKVKNSYEEPLKKVIDDKDREIEEYRAESAIKFNIEEKQRQKILQTGKKFARIMITIALVIFILLIFLPEFMIIDEIIRKIIRIFFGLLSIASLCDLISLKIIGNRISKWRSKKLAIQWKINIELD